jgi:hypothetical protein
MTCLIDKNESLCPVRNHQKTISALRPVYTSRDFGVGRNGATGIIQIEFGRATSCDTVRHNNQCPCKQTLTQNSAGQTKMVALDSLEPL